MPESIHKGHRQRLKERFAQEGLDNFTDVQALELALFYVLPRRDTNPIAHALLDHFGSLDQVLDAPVEEMAKVPGVGESAAVFLHGGFTGNHAAGSGVALHGGFGGDYGSVLGITGAAVPAGTGSFVPEGFLKLQQHAAVGIKRLCSVQQRIGLSMEAAVTEKGRLAVFVIGLPRNPAHPGIGAQSVCFLFRDGAVRKVNLIFVLQQHPVR